MVVNIQSMGLFGMNAFTVDVETDISSGVPSFDIVGLPDAAIKESRDRIRSAIKNTGFDFPLGKIVVNLAPADIRKVGSLYDLPILISILLSCGFIRKMPENAAFIGEVSLSGEIRPVANTERRIGEAARLGFKRIYVSSFTPLGEQLPKGIKIVKVADVPALVKALFKNA